MVTALARRKTVGSGTRVNGSATAATAATASQLLLRSSSHLWAAYTYSMLRNSGSAYGRV